MPQNKDNDRRLNKSKPRKGKKEETILIKWEDSFETDVQIIELSIQDWAFKDFFTEKDSIINLN
jgi:hypothetical protein